MMMKKSASLKLIPSNSRPPLKLDKIDFNPSEQMIGKSRIDNLPILPRRSSLGSLRKNQQSRLILDQNPKYIISELNAKIGELSKENAELKRRVEQQNIRNAQFLRIQRERKMYTQTASSVNTSKDYKANILSRLNSNNVSHTKSKCPSNTQCETGLFNSKFSLSQNQNTIAETYQSYQKGNKINTDKLLKIVGNYFEQFQSNYLKLKIIIQNFSGSSRVSHEQAEDIRQLSDILTLFKVPILFKKNPQMLAKSISKEKQKNQHKPMSRQKQGSINNNFCAEMKSADETLRILQALLTKVTKSERMLEKIRANQVIKKIFKRLYNL